jgi:hypothetical protein
MKKLLYFFLGCIVLGVAMSMVIGTLPALQMVGTSFLVNIKEGNFIQAYTVFSPDCKQRLPLENFVNYSKLNKLNHYKEVKWLKTVMEPNKTRGYILGDVTLNTAEVVPIELQFVKLKTSSTLQSEGWFVDDMFVGKEVILRQSRMPATPAPAK